MASLVLHPFFMPLYGVLALMATGAVPLLNVGSFGARFVGMTAIYTMLFPWASLVLMRVLGVVDSMSVNVPRQRIVPMVVLIICYISFVVAMHRVPLVQMVGGFMIGAAMCVAVAMLVTPRWKISLHLISAGGAVALALMLVLSGTHSALWLLCVAIAAAGCLASARLHLGSHTPAQVAVGFCVGFAMVTASLLFV